MKKNKNSKLYLVIPCYNEEEVLPETSKRLKNKIQTMINNKTINQNSKIIFINDGSKDNTWNLIKKYCKESNLFGGIDLSRNRGHQNALLAGLMTVKDECDIVISLDADLQDDINVIDKFVDEYYKGSEIVYGVRNSRKKDTWFKRTTAQCFYRFMKQMGVEVVYNHADYRLTSSRVLNYLCEYRESNLFLRGIFPLIGFKSSVVEYERNERFAGESKYPLKKMFSFAFEGITSFSIKPVHLILNTGLLLTFFSTVTLLVLMILRIMDKFSSDLCIILAFISLALGLTTIFIGIIGEYIGKVYFEVKQRPRFIV